MKRLQKKIRNKWKSCTGMSFVEVLCAVLILLLVSGGMTSAVTLAVNQYQKSMRNSESKVLYSTLMTVIGNELTYTTHIVVDSLDGSGVGNVERFQSQNFAIEHNLSTIMTDKSGTNDYGQILFGNSSNPEESMNLLGKAAYTNGLLAKVTSITYNNYTHYFTVYLSIGYDGTECYGGEFQVKNVNEREAQILGS